MKLFLPSHRWIVNILKPISCFLIHNFGNHRQKRHMDHPEKGPILALNGLKFVSKAKI